MSSDSHNPNRQMSPFEIAKRLNQRLTDNLNQADRLHLGLLEVRQKIAMMREFKEFTNRLNECVNDNGCEEMVRKIQLESELVRKYRSENEALSAGYAEVRGVLDLVMDTYRSKMAAIFDQQQPIYENTGIGPLLLVDDDSEDRSAILTQRIQKQFHQIELLTEAVSALAESEAIAEAKYKLEIERLKNRTTTLELHLRSACDLILAYKKHDQNPNVDLNGHTENTEKNSDE